jgi:hypothetical protein
VLWRGEDAHLHELDDEIHDLVLEHGLGVEVGDQEGDVVALDGLPPEDDEVLGTLGQEAHELLAEDGLELVGLLDADGNSAQHNSTHAHDGRGQQKTQHLKSATIVQPSPVQSSRSARASSHACAQLAFSFLFSSIFFGANRLGARAVPDGVDRTLDEDLLVLVAANNYRVEQQLLVGPVGE